MEGKHGHATKSENSGSGLPNSGGNRVEILWVVFLNVGYLMLIVGIRN
jgi:hypothetical protein